MRPGAPAVCFGTVIHRRTTPAEHHFTYPVNQVWLDPDHPEALFDRHPLWSSSRPAPIRFNRRDYLDGHDLPLGPAVRTHLAGALGRSPAGPLRMLTQPRTWGWLFNPITIYLAWDGDPGPDTGPVAALLEVTNTPWKERHLYPVALEPADDARRYRATFAKVLHVSPFLDEAFSYRFALSASDSGRDAGSVRRLTVDLDVIDHRTALPPSRIRQRTADGPHYDSAPASDPAAGRVALTTRLVVDQHPVERRVLTRALKRNPLPTHRVSFGIHRQAFSLWRKRVPFVPHPRRRTDASTSTTSQP